MSISFRTGCGGWTAGFPYPADSPGEAAGVAEGFAQEVLDLGVGAAELVSGPARERVVHRRIEPEEELLSFGDHV
jgi:hypothetical protein